MTDAADIIANTFQTHFFTSRHSIYRSVTTRVQDVRHDSSANRSLTAIARCLQQETTVPCRKPSAVRDTPGCNGSPRWCDWRMAWNQRHANTRLTAIMPASNAIVAGLKRFSPTNATASARNFSYEIRHYNNKFGSPRYFFHCLLILDRRRYNLCVIFSYTK